MRHCRAARSPSMARRSRRTRLWYRQVPNYSWRRTGRCLPSSTASLVTGHRHTPALGWSVIRGRWQGPGRGAGRTRRGGCANSGRLPARVVTQSGNGVEQLHPVPDCRDPKLLQGLVRQARKDRLVYLILAECRLILPEAQAPQPDHDVHDGAHNQWWRASSSEASRVWRVALKFSGLLKAC